MTGTSRTGRAAWLWCVLVVAAVAAGPGAPWSAGTPAPGGPAAQTATAPPTLIRVTIAVPSVSDPFTDVYLARDLGIFARHGLDVQIVSMKPPTAFAALQAGEIDFWTGAGSGAKAAEAGRPLRVVFLASKAPVMLVVGAKDVTALAQLRGGAVAVKAPLDTTSLVTEYLLRRAGVAPGSYKLLYVGTTGAQVGVLQKGLAAAATVEVGSALRLEKEGYKVIGNPLTTMRLFGAGLVTSLAEIRTKPDVIRRAVAAERDALRVILTRKDAVVAVLQHDFHSSPSEASQIYDLLKDTWNPTGIPPAEAVRTEIQLDTEVLQESHAGPNRPLRESDFTDLQFVQGGGG